MAQFMHDFNRMKVKINHLMNAQRESEQRIQTLESTVGRLDAENIKLKTDMKIMRDEHTEVLHAMFSFEKRNQELLKENTEIRANHSRDYAALVSMNAKNTALMMQDRSLHL